MDVLTFLGTGDSMGVPRVYCSCSICMEARTTGHNVRFRSSVMVEIDAEEDSADVSPGFILGCGASDSHESGAAGINHSKSSSLENGFLIDCGPDWVIQMENEGIQRVGHILLTHAHHDHIAGLPQWADACRWTKRKGHVYAPSEVFEVLRRQYPWLEAFLHYHEIDQRLSLWGWTVQTWRVCHGKNGYSYAYRFEKDAFCWAYCPDSISLSEEQKKPLAGLDLLILGTNFYKEEAALRTRSVYDMVEALDLIREAQPKRVLFTHMSHGVDAAHDYGLPAHTAMARQGMRIGLKANNI